MKKTNQKTVTVNKLQSDVSKIIKDVEKGQTYHVMRYSKPVAVVISPDEYECLTGECRGCVKQLVAELKSEARNPKSETNSNDKNLKI